MASKYLLADSCKNSLRSSRLAVFGGITGILMVLSLNFLKLSLFLFKSIEKWPKKKSESLIYDFVPLKAILFNDKILVLVDI
jgi:hypothetical protein